MLKKNIVLIIFLTVIITSIVTGGILILWFCSPPQRWRNEAQFRVEIETLFPLGTPYEKTVLWLKRQPTTRFGIGHYDEVQGFGCVHGQIHNLYSEPTFYSEYMVVEFFLIKMDG